MIILIMGVSGAGKTTVGRLLAEATGSAFLDADAFHSEANQAKMSRGIPLDDADRAPWLQALAAALDELVREGKSAVMACSALKASYRAVLLRHPAQMKVVYLRGSFDLLRARIEQRQGHFMPSTLLQSQLAALEEPEDAIVVDVSAPPDILVEEIRAKLGI